MIPFGDSPSARVLAALVRAEQGAHSDRLLQEELARHPQWSTAERGTFVARFRGVLESARDLDRRLDTRLIKRPGRGLHQALRLGLFLLDSGGPPPKVLDGLLHELAGASARERGLVNGVLRAMLREGQTPATARVTPLSRLPRWLAEGLDPGPGITADQAAAALLAPCPPWLRVRQSRMALEPALERLEQAGLNPRPDDSGSGFLRLEHLPEGGLSAVPGIREGSLVVQDLSTRGAVELLDATPGDRVLDACAAPGNKSLALLDRWPGIRLVAQELDPGRARSLEQRLATEGVTVQHGNLLERTDHGRWPRILLDLPCSGSGSVLRRPEILLRDQGPLERGLPELQTRLLEKAAALLEPDGLLVYSTCSLLALENQERVRRFLVDHRDFRIEADRVPEPFRDELGGWSWKPWITPGAGGAWAIALRRMS